MNQLRPPGNLCQEFESEGSRSPGRRPQARKCLEQRAIARRFARDKAWSEPGNPHGRGFPGSLTIVEPVSKVSATAEFDMGLLLRTVLV